MPKPNVDDDFCKEANDFTAECFQEIIDVLNKFIEDPETKQKLFNDMNDDFKKYLGGNIKV
jgi:hypothetical protein